MPLIHNAATSDDRHKRPLWRGWQRPELRPTLQQNLEHLSNGGLLGLLPASIGMVVADVDEYDKDGLADWMTDTRPWATFPASSPGGRTSTTTAAHPSITGSSGDSASTGYPWISGAGMVS